MGPEPLIIGIDSSLTATGIAAINCGSVVKLHVVKTRPQNFTSKEVRVRYIATEVMKKVSEVCEVVGEPPTNCWWGIEDYALGKVVGRLIDLAEVGCLIKQTLWSLTGRLPLKVNPKTLKKFIVGHGSNVKKNLHLAYAHAKWKIIFPNDDVCDAFAVAKLVEAVVVRDKNDLYLYEEQCVQKVLETNPDWYTVFQGWKEAQDGRSS